MRALILLLPLAVAFAGDLAPLEEATRQWASDSAEDRDAASRVVAAHMRRELAPVVAALESKDPEVRRRARASLESLVPPRPPEPAAPQVPPWVGGRVVINQAGAGQRLRIVVGQQGQVLVAADEGEEEALKEKGIAGQPFTDPVGREQLGLAEGRGFAVTSVEPRSLAALLGIRRNDILVKIDDKPVMQAAEVLKALAAEAPSVTVLRRGELVTLPARDEEGSAGEEN